MQRIVYQNDEGGISVIYPTPEALGQGWTIEQIAKKDVPAGKAYTIVDVETIPADHTFRNAWTHDGKAFGYDMPKARNLHREKLRQLRKPLLDALDVQTMRALEAGNPLDTIKAKKQALRDVTAHPDIEAATTAEQLKAVMPDALKG